MNVVLSNSSADPIYLQIVKQIKHQIITGELAEGDPLPSIRKLALDLQISVITTKRAYEDLEKEGMIDSIPGRGMFVAVQNRELLREKKMRLIEEKLVEVVAEAKLHGFDRGELEQMLRLLFEEE
jgi:GntR family transcriptional regulator